MDINTLAKTIEDFNQPTPPQATKLDPQFGEDDYTATVKKNLPQSRKSKRSKENKGNYGIPKQERIAKMATDAAFDVHSYLAREPFGKSNDKKLFKDLPPHVFDFFDFAVKKFCGSSLAQANGTGRNFAPAKLLIVHAARVLNPLAGIKRPGLLWQMIGNKTI
jgi:hypothetical protein